MNIALLTYPIEKSPGGVGVLVQNLVRNIITLDQDNTYHLVHYEKYDNPIYEQNEILYKHYQHLPVMFSDSWYLRRNSEKFDIVHRFSPGGFIFAIKSKIVVSVNDLFLYKSYPFNQTLKINLARHFNRNSIRKADAVIAISEFTKQEIIETFNISERKIHVVYCAPNDFEVPPNGSDELLIEHYGITKKFILFVSTIEPRKNLLSLVKAFEMLKERYGIPESLVIVGQKGWGFKATLNYIERSKYKNYIIQTGYVPSSHLPAFYSLASLFVYPSFMEGFGIPPLEAMQFGCPTLTSNTSSLPEVVPHPEMMFDPHDANDIAQKCLTILTDPDARSRNIDLGWENVKRFSWQESARRIIEIYNSLQS